MIGRRELIALAAATPSIAYAQTPICDFAIDYEPKARDFQIWRSVIWRFFAALERKDVDQAMAFTTSSMLLTDDKLHGDINEYRGGQAAAYFRRRMDKAHAVGLKVLTMIDHAGDVFVFLKENFRVGSFDECGFRGPTMDRLYRFRFENDERHIAALHMSY